MITLQGKGVHGGIAIGRISFFRRSKNSVSRYTVSDPSAELDRFCQARAQAEQELDALYQQALRDIGEESAQIFEIHRMMLEDEDYNDAVRALLRNKKINAEAAVADASETFSAIFAAMNDPYMQARAADIRDISNRLISVLAGKTECRIHENDETAILCADDLSPSEAMQLDRRKVAAIVTSSGSVNSHTAILARAMDIPAVVGVGDALLAVAEESDAVVDGSGGAIYVSPDKETLTRMRARKEQESQTRQLLQKQKGADNVTLDGTRIDLFANIQGLGEIDTALENDAGGIGLFRSEFLYLERNSMPSEEEQFNAYKAVLQRMGEKKVIIRTLDVGADKQADYLGLEKEENPALGLRGIRICLTRPALFHTQLRALLRASVFGSLAILFPMITSVEEVMQVLHTVLGVKKELSSEGIPFSEDTELGIMIETPAAAIISDKLAPLVDFFSVGTNDLTQYTLALDRQNRSVSPFFDPHHPAVLRLIATATENAHRHGKWIGICGELGADPTLTERFLRMGIDELSVAPSAVLPLRAAIRGMDLRDNDERNERSYAPRKEIHGNL